MGRPAKSPERNWLDSTKSQATNGPAAFASGRPKIPRHLSPLARRAFKRAVKLLAERGTLVESNETTLELYAETWARWIRVKTEAGDSLMVDVSVTDNNGKVRVVRKLNPLLKLLAETESRLLALAKSLGLTQVDLGRCKLTAESADEKTEEQIEAERALAAFNAPKEISWRPPQPIAAPPTLEDEDE
jgi:P27 family predicted phage terminase small subunit